MIDQQGNITLDRAADEYVPLSRFDDSGVQLDISTSDIKFIVQNGFTLIPGLNPSDPLGRLLHFDEASAISLGTKTRDFMILLTEGTDGTPLLRGSITASGFAQ